MVRYAKQNNYNTHSQHWMHLLLSLHMFTDAAPHSKTTHLYTLYMHIKYTTEKTHTHTRTNNPTITKNQRTHRGPTATLKNGSDSQKKGEKHGLKYTSVHFKLVKSCQEIILNLWLYIILREPVENGVCECIEKIWSCRKEKFANV